MNQHMWKIVVQAAMVALIIIEKWIRSQQRRIFERLRVHPEGHIWSRSKKAGAKGCAYFVVIPAMAVHLIFSLPEIIRV